MPPIPPMPPPGGIAGIADLSSGFSATIASVVSSMLATEAAWRTGEAWLNALLPYLTAARDFFDARIEAAAPGARSMRLDSTYLAWVDF